MCSNINLSPRSSLRPSSSLWTTSRCDYFQFVICVVSNCSVISQGLPLNLMLCCTLNHLVYLCLHRRNKYRIAKIRQNAIRRDLFTIPEVSEVPESTNCGESGRYTPSISPVLGERIADVDLDTIHLDTVERSETDRGQSCHAHLDSQHSNSSSHSISHSNHHDYVDMLHFDDRLSFSETESTSIVNLPISLFSVELN